MDIADEEFSEEFSMFGFDVNEPDVLDKLRQLCQIHQLSASDVSIQWVAYSKTSKCAINSISVEQLDLMERDRLLKSHAKPSKTPVRKQNTRKLDVTAFSAMDGINDDILGAYTNTPASKAVKRQHTPDNPVNKRLTGVSRTSNPVVPFSPSSFSPTSATPSKKYSSRTQAGEVVCSFGPASNAMWKSRRTELPEIKPYDESISLTKKFKYMFQKLTDKALVLDDILEEMTKLLQEHHKVEELAHVALPVQEEVSVAGRIACDSNGKINAKSVILQGSRETSGGKEIPVELSTVPQYSLFPGQIVLMNGLNSTGNKFVAKKVFESIPLPLPKSTSRLQNGPLSVVIATGPFTTSDCLSYEPLTDLITYLIKETPDVCILLGPFVDSKNAELEQSLENQTYEEFFQQIIEKAVNAITRLPTKLIIVPSNRDVHHEFVYPQPPFSFNMNVVEKSVQHKVLFVSDPCTLVIDGVVFGISSTDILFHFGAEEISYPSGSDRLARLAKHVLTQHSYYPLHPSADDVNIDYEHYEEYAKLPVTPHVLILPSDLRYFVKDICGCCCVNPGRLTKGQTGGTYARFVINPGKAGGGNAETSIVNSVAAQIRKI